MNDNTLASRWALVTGASAGIGTAIARELAARGANLILTARRIDRLEDLGNELKQRHAVQVETVGADLAEADASRQLCDEIARRGLAVDVLVNNAGYGVSGHLQSHPWDVHARFLQVMTIAPCELAWRLLPAMQQRGYGRIVNVASLAGLVPGAPGNTLYGAAKAFLIRFSESLALENTGKGIHVCALCPGFTYSEFHDVTGTRGIVSKMPKWMWLSAEEVAREGVNAVERGDVVRVTGRVNRTIKTLLKLIPERLALRSMRGLSRSFRKQEGS